MPLKPGQILAHYRIERLIGQGGMGSVFEARDTKLNRVVALKVLPPEMSADTTRLVRFRREAQAVAALNHPHIVTIHSVEEAGGTHFLTMELVEGESLDHKLRPGGLPLAQVFDIGIALADALAAAHGKGIIHRDLKPANVMVTEDGRVKVLDFGLAKLAPGLPESGAAEGGLDASKTPTETMQPYHSVTGAGMMLGTVPYMSPEQAGGEELDARTDIFSLGVVLYELATGRRPFRGRNYFETISSILRDVPQPVTEARGDLPRHLARIIDHCLQKDPEARFQTAKDVGNDLRALRREVESGVGRTSESVPAASPRSSGATGFANGLGKGVWIRIAAAVLIVVVGLVLYLARGREKPPEVATSPAPDPKSIAVLPFVNMSSDKEQDYFSDGMSEELLNLLAKIPQLRVAARTSSFSFKGKEVEIPQIARQLHVAHVLEGSVRKAGSRVRITAQLVHAVDGYRLWSQTYDRKLDDIFAIQDEIAADVVKELKVTLLGAAPKTRQTDPEAYALFLQAVHFMRQFTPEACDRSDALLRRVLERDRRYAPAWSVAAANFMSRVNLGLMSSAEGYARAREALTKALEIDPQLAPAEAQLGLIAMQREHDLAAAARHLKRALELDPAQLDVLDISATLLQELGRSEEALALREAVVRRDPLNVTYLYNLGGGRYKCRRPDAAIAALRTAQSLGPGDATHYVITLALLLKGDAQAALAEIEQESSEAWRMIGLPMAYHALGRKADSDAALAELLRMPEKDFSYNFASVYAFRGEADRAFAWLDKAAEYKDVGLGEIVGENLFASIGNDPRWLPFLRRIGMAPEQLAKIEFKVSLPE